MGESQRRSGTILEEDSLSDLQKIDSRSRLTVNSGALRGDGDIHTSEFCIDCKAKSSAKNYIATRDEVRAAKKQGLRSRRIPAILIENSNGDKVVTIPYSSFLEVVSRIEDLKELLEEAGVREDDEEG